MDRSLCSPASRALAGIAAASLVASSWAQQATVVDQTPLRQPPTQTGIDGKSVPAVVEKRVLADPATKRYMPCRDANDAKSTDADASPVKLNPKAAVLSEEAAKQHGYKPSPHKVDCPG